MVYDPLILSSFALLPLTKVHLKKIAFLRLMKHQRMKFAALLQLLLIAFVKTKACMSIVVERLMDDMFTYDL